jgi:hypothetical protein
MTLSSLTLDTIAVDDEDWTEVGVPTVEEWLRMCGVRPGVSSPRCHTVALHPDCAAHAGWLQALWGFA